MQPLLFLFFCISIYNSSYSAEAAGAGAGAQTQQQLPSKVALFKSLLEKHIFISLGIFNPSVKISDQEAQNRLSNALKQEPFLSTTDLHFIAEDMLPGHKEQFFKVLKAFNIVLSPDTPATVELARYAANYGDDQVTEFLEKGANPYAPVLGLSFCDHIAIPYDSLKGIGYHENIHAAWRKFEASDRGKWLLAVHRSLPDYRQARKRLQLRASFNALAQEDNPGNHQKLAHDHAYNVFRKTLADLKLSESDIAQSLASVIGKEFQAAHCAHPEQPIMKARPKFMETLEDFKHALDAQDYSINDVMALIPEFDKK